MNKLLLGLAIAGLVGTTLGDDIVKPRTGDSSAMYVTVPLEDYVNDFKEQAFPAKRILLKNIPFDLVDKPGADNLFLKSAEWSDWKTDPSGYYVAYDQKPKEKTPQRPILQIPVADYSALWLLAAADNDKSLSQVATFRIGAIRGANRTTYHDFSVTIPRSSEKTGIGVVATLPGKDGNLFLLRVPLVRAFAQDFKNEVSLDVDVTKELRLAIRRPDPCRFNLRPLGLPSGVHIYGMTFERSPVQMEVTSNESGHVFNEPQTPTFNVTLRNTSASTVKCLLTGTATDYYGNVTTVSVPEVQIWPYRDKTVELPVKPGKLGYHDLTVEIKIGKKVLLRRDTAFALLPPDTRKFRDESPFGVWDFGGVHYTPDSPDIVGPLYVKAGLRYGMFTHPVEIRRKYGILKGNESLKVNSGTKDASKAVADAKAKQNAAPDAEPIKRAMIFHEDAISGDHVTRVPDMFTGKAPYKFNESEQKKFEKMWEVAENGAKAIRKEFPDTEIYFGNGTPHLLEEFLKRKFPKELLGSRGNESMCGPRLPETQPLDFISSNSGLWMDRQILDHYGYKDTPLRQCYEITYPDSNPGNLTFRTQAAYLIRHVMHSLVWEIPIIRFMGIVDVGNSYYYSNWGGLGLCQAMPDVRPKPAYVAVATMTSMLDGAKFTRAIPTDSSTVYAVEFQRRDKQFVTCLWTIRGKRKLNLSFASAAPVVGTDLMGNSVTASVADKAVNVEISSEPIYLTSAASIVKIASAPAVLEGRPKDKSFVISPLDATSEWTVEQEHSPELENYDFICPRRKGDFTYRDVANFAGEAKVMEIRPKLPAEGSVYLPMYSVLKHNNGVEIPGEPTEIGLMVNGNGGWGRVIFELEDASGQRWISIGAEQSGAPSANMADWMSKEEFEKLSTSKSKGVNDWNTTDIWGRSYINFEGWRYLKFPLTGNYPGEGYHWPRSSQWRYSGDGVVKYPLKFKKLIFTIPEKVLYLKDYKTVTRQEIYVKDLMVTYEPPEKAFAAE